MENRENDRQECNDILRREKERELWHLLAEQQGKVFYTAKHLEFTYKIRGGELFVDRKAKSITQATVYKAYHKALELEGKVSGPKKLGTFGASYLYPIFLQLSIIKQKSGTEAEKNSFAAERKMGGTMSREMDEIRQDIQKARTALGIELGSTRIKAVLIDSENAPVASGSYEWENQLENGIWTYSLESIWTGLQAAYRDMAGQVKAQYGITLEKIGAIGFSAMMHGYMAFDGRGELLVPFRTWRNTMTLEASEILSERFGFHIPQRWSVAHLYQAILNGETHVERIRYLTTLSGYIHWKMTGRKVLGIGDASGMFPIDAQTKDYDRTMLQQFEELVSGKGYDWKLCELLPEVRLAGEDAGTLTAEGAALLDPEGNLQPGISVCPPEGDAGTGMTATNSVARRTGNVSAGTSVFAMVVLEKPLSRAYEELDIVTTPDGSPVAMVHCNNGTSDLNAWVDLFGEFLETMGMSVDRNTLFSALYHKALEGEKDAGGLLSCCYLSGEHITGFEKGRPFFVRTPESRFHLAEFMRSHLYASLATLKIGMDLLFKQENVELDELMGHGGFFKTRDVGQRVMAAAANVPVTVLETAGEGGAWGIALLAAYAVRHREGESLEEYLKGSVFAGENGSRMEPDPEDVAGFDIFMERYRKALGVERAAVEALQ